MLSSSTAQKKVGVLDGKWILVCYSDLTTQSNDCRPINAGLTARLQFEDDGESGKIIGSDGINSVYGSYTLLNNHVLKIDEFGGTKIGSGDPWVSNFWKTMHTASSYSIKLDSLIISYDNDSKAVKFLKSE